MDRDYRVALVVGGFVGIEITVIYLEWHYHRRVDWGLVVPTVLTLGLVVLLISKAHRNRRRK